MQAPEIAKLICGTIFRFVDERELQDQLDNLLRPRVPQLAREFQLTSSERIDFLCGRIGIEVKVAGTLSAVERQLYRYAKDPRVDSLILVTTRSSHNGVPNMIDGKPVIVAHLLSSIF